MIALWIIASYLLGSLSFSYIIGKLFYGVDIHTRGYRTAGTSNAFLVLGRSAGVATLLGDVGKGFAAAAVAILLQMPEWAVYLSGIAAILGHCFPLYFGFRGGKGKATTVGMALAVVWIGSSLQYQPYALLLLLTFFLIPLGVDGGKRKLLRAAMLLAPLLYLLFSRNALLVVLGVLLLCLVATEHARLSSAMWVKRLAALGVFKTEERKRISGLTWFAMAFFLLVLLFAKPIAITAMLMMLFGDWAAMLAGKRFGRHHIGHRTLEGSLAMLVVCLITGFIARGFLPIAPLQILGGAAAATIAELASVKVDDNLTVGLAAAVVMSLL